MEIPNETIRSLKEWPHAGRPGTEQDTREILFSALALCRRLPCARADH